MWDEEAKQEMITCTEIAGLVQGPHCNDLDASPHPATIVLEPEAASFYCQEKSNFPLSDGDKILAVDVGGGTVDLASHQKVGPLWSKKVREVAPSSGGLYGGTYIDVGFFKKNSQKIRCFQKFAEEQPKTALVLKGLWEPIKCRFDGNMLFDYELELPAKLALAWEDDDALRGGQLTSDAYYDSISVTLEDMLSIFDPVIDQILQLIKDAMIPDLKAMMIVGDFSASPCLKHRIKAAFSPRLAPEIIIFPTEPGSAICCGAVAFGVDGSDLVMSRISKKTFGTYIVRLFHQGDPTHFKFVDNGDSWCDNVFDVFTRKSETVPVNSCVSHTFSPFFYYHTQMKIRLFSTSNSDPDYVTNPGTHKEGSFTVKHPSRNELGENPEIRSQCISDV